MADKLLQELSPKHSRMAFYVARGYDKEGVAKRFGVTPQTLSRYMNDTLFKQEVTRIQKKIEERSMVLMEDALNPIYDSLKDFAKGIVDIANKSKSDNTRLKAIELGFKLVQPSLQDEKDQKKQQPELRMKIKMVNDTVAGTPELQLVGGGK